LQWSGETVKRKVVEPWGLEDAERRFICEEKIWDAHPYFELLSYLLLELCSVDAQLRGRS
jgi:hypothetical protein